MERWIYFFYIFFQGTLFLQAVIFIALYKTSGKKELLYYSLFLLLIAVNFLISDPSTFGLGDDDAVLNSKWYKLVNTPLVVVANIFYILFLKEFYSTLTRNRLFFSILRYTLYSLIGALALFLILFVVGLHSNLMFNIINLLGAVVGIWLVNIIIRERMPFTKLMAYGFIINLAGTLISVCMLILLTQGVKHLLVSEYPFTFIKLGLLAEIFFFNLAIFKKWHRQEKELEIHQLKTELAVEKIKSQISKELHDDIGSTLSGINMYSHLAQQQIKEGNQATSGKTLDLIQQASDEMIYKLKDIVWAIQPSNENLKHLTDKINEYAIFITGAKKIGLQTNYIMEDEELKFSAYAMHHIYTIAKEALNNAVKYSEATLISIDTGLSNNQFVLNISDNGAGFDRQQIAEGNGLMNMQKRADEIGAVLQLTSNAGDGTELQLKLLITK